MMAILTLAASLAAPMDLTPFWGRPNPCGGWALLYGAHWCGKPIGPDEVEQLLGTNSEPRSLTELATAFSKLEIRAQMWRCAGKQLPRQTPAVFVLRDKAGTQHYVFVAECADGKCLALEPATGAVWVDQDALFALWQGDVLLLGDNPDGSWSLREPVYGSALAAIFLLAAGAIQWRRWLNSRRLRLANNRMGEN